MKKGPEKRLRPVPPPESHRAPPPTPIIAAIDRTRLEILLNDLFVNNFSSRDGSQISPISSPAVTGKLPLDRDAYLQRIQEFNDRFGNFLKVEVSNGRVVVKFFLNPQALAEKLVELGKVRGMPLTSRRGSVTYEVSGGAPDHSYVVLLLPAHMNGLITEVFDPVKHSASPTFILPYLQPKFAHALIRMYIESLLPKNA